MRASTLCCRHYETKLINEPKANNRKMSVSILNYSSYLTVLNSKTSGHHPSFDAKING